MVTIGKGYADHPEIEATAAHSLNPRLSNDLFQRFVKALHIDAKQDDADEQQRREIGPQ
jgi:hypothetical protein